MKLFTSRTTLFGAAITAAAAGSWCGNRYEEELGKAMLSKPVNEGTPPPPSADCAAP